jgi:hypothetical protein
MALALLALAWASPAAPSQVITATAHTQVQFAGPTGMKVRWYVKAADGKESYSDPPLVIPARYNFKQGCVYRLKLTHIPGFPGLEVYPTLEVPFAGPAATTFLAHSAVPLKLTDEDFQQVQAGKVVVKTIYMPGEGGPTAANGTPLLIVRLGNLIP